MTECEENFLWDLANGKVRCDFSSKKKLEGDTPSTKFLEGLVTKLNPPLRKSSSCIILYSRNLDRISPPCMQYISYSFSSENFVINQNNFLVDIFFPLTAFHPKVFLHFVRSNYIFGPSIS